MLYQKKQRNLSFRFRQTKYPQNGSMTNMPICRTKVGILCKKKRKKGNKNGTVYSGNSERLNSEQSLISEHFW